MAPSRWLHTERPGLSRPVAAMTIVLVLIIFGGAVAILEIQPSSASKTSSGSNGGSQVSSSSSPSLSGVQVAVASQNLVAADLLFTDPATPLTCSASGAANDLILTNAGTAATSVTGVTITWAGALNYFSVSGTCDVEPGTPVSILFSPSNHLGTNAVYGQTYSGTVELGDGEELSFSGSFN